MKAHRFSTLKKISYSILVFTGLHVPVQQAGKSQIDIAISYMGQEIEV